jgi:glutathione S-transferase
MTSQTPPTLYYAPKTRASGTRMMLEELGGAYALHVLDLSKGENRSPEFLAINPLGKVPTLRHGETCIRKRDWRRERPIRRGDPIFVGWFITPLVSNRR